jgi:hypothetical protein
MRFQLIRNRGFKLVVALFAIVLLTGVPAQAGPVVANDVIQLLRNYRNPPDLLLRNVPQNPALDTNSFFQNPAGQTGRKGSREILAPATESLLGGFIVGADPQQIDVIAQGDVEGTVCDCGEIEIPGGFPKWPLFLLGGIPFFFIHDCDNCDETPLPPVTPTPNPTPPPSIPEPATLILFGTGIAAFGVRYRRRRARSESKAELTKTEDLT